MLAYGRSFIFWGGCRAGGVGGVHDTVLTSVLLSYNALRWGWGLASPTRLLLHQDPIAVALSSEWVDPPPQQPLGQQRPRKQIRIPGSGSPPPPPTPQTSIVLWLCQRAESHHGKAHFKHSAWLDHQSLNPPSFFFLFVFFYTQCNINAECCCRFCEIWRKSTSLASLLLGINQRSSSLPLFSSFGYLF